MTKPDKIDLIVQLFLAHWVFGTLGTPFPAFGKNFWSPMGKILVGSVGSLGSHGSLGSYGSLGSFGSHGSLGSLKSLGSLGFHE